MPRSDEHPAASPWTDSAYTGTVEYSREMCPRTMGILNRALRFGFNMQHSVIGHSFLRTLSGKGPLFQSPYPDYYATNALFLKAESILVCPMPLVIIGISPKSFGFYYHNFMEKEGGEFLKNLPKGERDRLRNILLPGTDINTCWLLAMEALHANYGDEYGLSVNRRRYRFLQALTVYRGRYVTGRLDRSAVAELSRNLTPFEKVLYGGFLRGAARIWGTIPAGWRRRFSALPLAFGGQFPASCRENRAPGRFRDLLDVFEHVEPWRP